MRLLMSLIGIALGTTAASAQPAKAYFITEVDGTNPAIDSEAEAAIVKLYDGEFIVRRTIVIAHGSVPKSVTVVEFDSLQEAEKYAHSAEYKAAALARGMAGKFRTYIVEGGDSPR
jgi:uncharacterized protein (DUF1330 family)